MVSRPLSATLALAAVTTLGGCKTLLGIDDGVVGNGKVDGAIDTALPDGDVDAPEDAVDAATTPWWDPTFPSRRPITLATTGLTLPIANLPVLVRFPADVLTELQASGADVRFVADDHQTTIPFELDTGTPLHAWVKLSLTAQNQRFWMYYGNTSVVSQSNGIAVFGVDYESVHHLGTLTDSTGNNHTADAPTPSMPLVVDSIIGRGRQFDGANDYLALANSVTPFDYTGDMSVSAWIKTSDFTQDYQPIVTKGDTAWRIQRDAASAHVTFGSGSGGNTDNVVGNTVIDNNLWHHVLATREGNAKSIYVDGILVAIHSTAPTSPSSTNGVRIGGNDQATSRAWVGLIDEVRISATPRTAAWAKAEYVMVSTSFATVGAREMY